jgi:hypothetical protein
MRSSGSSRLACGAVPNSQTADQYAPLHSLRLRETDSAASDPMANPESKSVLRTAYRRLRLSRHIQPLTKLQMTWTPCYRSDPRSINPMLKKETADAPQTLSRLALIYRPQLLLASRLAKSGVPAGFVKRATARVPLGHRAVSR